MAKFVTKLEKGCRSVGFKVFSRLFPSKSLRVRTFRKGGKFLHLFEFLHPGKNTEILSQNCVKEGL